MKKVLGLFSSLFLVVALVGCGASDDGSGTTDPEPPPDEPGALYCVISDGGGFEDKSFNQSAKAGLEQAKSEVGIEVKAVESKGPEDFEPNINSAIAEGCKLIITVGFNLADATRAAAEANPTLNFAIIDDASIDLPNVKSIVFNTAEAGYLAGYLAAGVSKSGVVGTYGGMAIPSVQIFSDGFYQGVEAYNAAKGKAVKVIGWDAADPSKYQVADSFVDTVVGKQIAETQIGQGADVILPVAGGTGLGAAQAASEKGVKYIWVDVDGYNTNPTEYLPFLLSSVLKNIQAAVADVVKQTESSFDPSPYVGTIANNGVGIAPYHDLDGEVSDELKGEILELTSQIAAGTLKIETAFAPAG